MTSKDFILILLDSMITGVIAFFGTYRHFLYVNKATVDKDVEKNFHPIIHHHDPFAKICNNQTYRYWIGSISPDDRESAINFFRRPRE